MIKAVLAECDTLAAVVGFAAWSYGWYQVTPALAWIMGGAAVMGAACLPYVLRLLK